MNSADKLKRITDEIATEAKRILGKSLDAVLLYGSYARGDFDNESDIDIMVRIDCPIDRLSDYEEEFYHIAGRLSLEYDVTVSVSLRDKFTFYKFVGALPFYANIEKEGVKIA